MFNLLEVPASGLAFDTAWMVIGLRPQGKRPAVVMRMGEVLVCLNVTLTVELHLKQVFSMDLLNQFL